jgi:hypothetical protein
MAAWTANQKVSIGTGSRNAGQDVAGVLLWRLAFCGGMDPIGQQPDTWFVEVL